MRERIPSAVLDEHPAGNEIVERGRHPVVAAAAGVAERIGVESPAEDGRGAGDLPRHLVGAGEPCLEQPARAGERLAARGHVLGDEERQPFGPHP